jgi:hypothetical protein
MICSFSFHGLGLLASSGSELSDTMNYLDILVGLLCLFPCLLSLQMFHLAQIGRPLINRDANADL